MNPSTFGFKQTSPSAWTPNPPASKWCHRNINAYCNIEAMKFHDNIAWLHNTPQTLIFWSDLQSPISLLHILQLLWNLMNAWQTAPSTNWVNESTNWKLVLKISCKCRYSFRFRNEPSNGAKILMIDEHCSNGTRNNRTHNCISDVLGIHWIKAWLAKFAW